MRVPAAVAAITGLLLAGCDSKSNPNAPLPPAVAEALSSSDSVTFRASAPPPSSLAATSSAGPIVLQDGDGFTITLVSRECASPTNTVSISGAVDLQLTTTACQEPIGRQWEFLGPFAAGDEVLFSFQSGVSGATGSFLISGARPLWTVTFEDGFDQDFNDFVLEVAILEFCTFFGAPPGVAVLENRAIQRSLIELADSSFFGEPLSQRREQGGILIERNGAFELVPRTYLDPPGLCSVASDAKQLTTLINDTLTTVLGTIHTHPVRDATVSNPGNCWRYRQRGKSLQRVPLTASTLRFGAGPSRADLNPWVNGTPPFPGFAMDSTYIYRWSKAGFGQPVQVDSFALAQGANACIR